MQYRAVSFIRGGMQARSAPRWRSALQAGALLIGAPWAVTRNKTGTPNSFQPNILTQGVTIMNLSKVRVVSVAIAAMAAGLTSPVFAMDDRTDLLEIDAKNFTRATVDRKSVV